MVVANASHSVISPLYAMLAERLLKSGKTVEAIEMCEQGIEAYPRYYTGYLLAAKAYIAAGRYADAGVICRKGLENMPSSEGLRKAMQNAAELVRAKTPAQASLRSPERISTDEIAEYARLARALENAKIPPVLDSSSMSAGISSEINEASDSLLEEKPPFVSATIAEIYARQGALAEAIAAYESLIRQTPLNNTMKKKYESRIEVLQAQMNQMR